MNNLPTTYNDYRFDGISQFQEMLQNLNCRYYASDLLQFVDSEELKMIEVSVHRAIEIFKTLHHETDNHFLKVYRGSSNGTFKDWKLSELACLYMLMDGDPRDLDSLVHQQTTLIDQMLHHVMELHTKPLASSVAG